MKRSAAQPQLRSALPDHTRWLGVLAIAAVRAEYGLAPAVNHIRRCNQISSVVLVHPPIRRASVVGGWVTAHTIWPVSNRFPGGATGHRQARPPKARRDETLPPLVLALGADRGSSHRRRSAECEKHRAPAIGRGDKPLGTVVRPGVAPRTGFTGPRDEEPQRSVDRSCDPSRPGAVVWSPRAAQRCPLLAIASLRSAGFNHTAGALDWACF